MVVITVFPQEALSDEKVDITVTGLESGQSVTLCGVLESGQKQIASIGTYVADQKGLVDLKRDPSISGTYTGVEPMGLFWSMVPTPGQRDGTFILPESVMVPEEIKISLFLGHLTMEEIFNQRRPVPIGDTIFLRLFLHKSVERIPVEAGRFKGFLFLPQGNEELAGVLDLMGLFGSCEHMTALLASRRFAVLGVTIPQMPYNTFTDYTFLQDGIEWLSCHPRVRRGVIGVMGICRSGRIALTLAAFSPQVKVCVSINGPPFYIHPALRHPDDTRNKDLRCNTDKLKYTENGVIVKDAFMYSDDELKSQTIEAWKGDAKTLMLVSEDDLFFPPDLYRWFQRQVPQNKKDNFEILSLQGAGHLLDVPYRPYIGKTWHPSLNILNLTGGDAKTHNRAQELFWSRLQTFFSENL